jgi:hypothetical protein
MFQYMKPEFQTKEMCMFILEKENIFQYIKPENQTREMCMIALEKYPYSSFEYVRKDLQTR